MERIDNNSLHATMPSKHMHLLSTIGRQLGKHGPLATKHASASSYTCCKAFAAHDYRDGHTSTINVAANSNTKNMTSGFQV
jgi:hypothetical protein